VDSARVFTLRGVSAQKQDSIFRIRGTDGRVIPNSRPSRNPVLVRPLVNRRGNDGRRDDAGSNSSKDVVAIDRPPLIAVWWRA